MRGWGDAWEVEYKYKGEITGVANSTRSTFGGCDKPP